VVANDILHSEFGENRSADFWNSKFDRNGTHGDLTGITYCHTTVT